MSDKTKLTNRVLARGRSIKLLGLDVDGVLTDGRLIFSDSGQEYKSFYARDGHGLQILRDQGIEVALITGRVSNVVKHRANNLNIRLIYQGQQNKALALQDILHQTGLQLHEIAYVGDDIIDLPILSLSELGLAIAVHDAHPMVIDHCHWQTSAPGGKGAVREVCEMLLKAQGCYEKTMQRYLEKT